MKSLFVALLLTSCIPAYAGYARVKDQPKTLQIIRHHGGDFYWHLSKMTAMSGAKTRIRFLGPCKSACTFYLSIKRERLCVGPKAKFYFHSYKPYASGLREWKVSKAEAQTMFDDYMLKQIYPRDLAAWIKKRGGLPREGWVVMTAKDAWKLGYRRCKGG